MRKNQVTVTRVAPVTDPKPQWLKQLHATAHQGIPQDNCQPCRAALVREAGR